MRNAAKVRCLVAVLALAAVACGETDPEDDAFTGDPEDLFYPLAGGAWWRHRVFDWASNQPEVPDKVVYCCPEREMPLRPGKIGFPALRKDENGYAYRWQEVTECAILRHYDEWFDLSWNRTRIRHFCPHQIRVASCDKAELGAAWRDDHVEAIVTLDPKAPGDWTVCEQIQIDSNSCQPIGEVPEGCLVTAIDGCFENWQVLAVEDPVTVPAGTFSTFKIQQLDEQGEIATFHWTRGVGKIKEDSQPVEREELIEYCTENCPPPPIHPNLPGLCPR